MKVFPLVLILITTLSSISAKDISKNPPLEESVFSFKNGKIYVNDQIIPKADVSSFHVLNAICHGDEDKHCFAADKNRVYYYNRALPNSDSKTFHFLGNGYSADKRNVFYIMDNVFAVINGADSKTFKVLKERGSSSYVYAKDKNHAYFDGVKLSGSHGKSFDLILKSGKYDAKDKFQYYKEGSSVKRKK